MAEAYYGGPAAREVRGDDTRPWIILFVAAMAMVGTLPGRTQGLGLITEPLIADIGVSRVGYATVNLWATLIGALFCLPCGRLVDRLGSRIVLTFVIAGLGATVLFMSAAHTMTALWITITLTRGFGQSALSVVSLALVGKWFSERLSMAMGIYSLIVGFGFIATFPTVGYAVQRFGWRRAWEVVGIVLLVVLAPAAWLLVRGNPAQGGSAEPSAESMSAAHLTMWQALASPAFWIFACSSSLFGLVYSGIALFNQSILEQRGFGPSTYYNVLILSTLLGLAANFGGGWSATKWPIQRLMGLGMAVLALALVALPFARTLTHVYLYAAAMGISGGVVTVVFFTVWGQVFGRAELGRIQGCAQMMTVVASAVGPLLLANTFQSSGSYDRMFFQLAGLTLLLGLAAWFVPLPNRRGL